MLMKRSRTVPFALLATIAALAGCSSTGHERPVASAQSSQAAPPTTMITWVGKVCDADADLRTQQGAVSTAAAYIGARHPTRKQLTGFISAVAGSMEKTRKSFQKLRHAPGIDGGDRLVSAYLSGVNGTLASLKDEKKTANDPSAPEFVLAALPQRVAIIIEGTAPEGTDLPSLAARNATLNRAYKQAKSCQGAPPIRATPSPTPAA